MGALIELPQVSKTKVHVRLEHFRNGRLIHLDESTNLSTTVGLDARCDLEGGGTFPTASKAATGTGSTSLTDSTQAWATNAYAGRKVWAVQGSTLVYGTIASNTATALTIDGWKTVLDGSAASTPGSTAVYAIGGRVAGTYLALSTDAGGVSAGDTTLASEVNNTNGLGRKAATYAHTPSTAVFTLVATWTATGGPTNSVQKVGLLDSLSGGTLVRESAITSRNIVTGDVLTVTYSITEN